MKILTTLLLMTTCLLSVIPLNAKSPFLTDKNIEVVVLGDDKSDLILFIIGDKYYLENKGVDLFEKIGMDVEKIKTMSCTTGKKDKQWKSAAEVIPKYIERVVTICEIVVKDSM